MLDARYSMLDLCVTHAVELTPGGRGAVAVVLVAGPAAVSAVDACFQAGSGRPLAELPIGRIAVGRWGGPEGEELVVCRRAEDRVEVHCHGGRAAVRGVIGPLIQRGCCEISWRDWLRHSSDDALRAEAHIALADAPTARTMGVLLDQYHGALSGAIRSAMAAIEARDWQRTATTLDGLLRYADVGLHLTTPWHVVLAGPPNVGKSSLINALAGFERAIVAPQAGTTRDVVTTGTAIAGWPVELADTAGLRKTSEELESAGVKLAHEAVLRADVVIAVQDARATGSDTNVERLLGALPPRVRILHVLNKVDLLDAAKRKGFDSNLSASEGNAGDSLARASGHGEARTAIATSAVTGQGIAALVDAIAHSLVPVAPPAGAAVPFRREHAAELEEARAAVARRDERAAESALQALLVGGKRSCGTP
jgi:tRNA modification GTPase